MAEQGIQTAIVLAGGQGRRMAELTQGQLSKTLLLIRGREILGHILDYLVSSGITRIGLSLGRHSKSVMEFVKSSQLRAEIVPVVEKKPLNTGGAIVYTAHCMNMVGSFLLINGDTLTNVDIHEMSTFRDKVCPDGALMALAPSSEPMTNRVVNMHPRTFQIERTRLYPTKNDLFSQCYVKHGEQHLVNAGLYIMSTNSLDSISTVIRPSIDDLVTALTRERCLFGFPTCAKYLNINTEYDLVRAEAEWDPHVMCGLLENWKVPDGSRESRANHERSDIRRGQEKNMPG